MPKIIHTIASAAKALETRNSVIRDLIEKRIIKGAFHEGLVLKIPAREIEKLKGSKHIPTKKKR